MADDHCRHLVFGNFNVYTKATDIPADRFNLRTLD